MSKFPVYLYRIYSRLHRLHIPFFPNLLMVLNRIIWGVYLPPSVSIGQNFSLSYGGSGVVIHANAVIGSNVVIGPGVTIGGRSRYVEVPVIGDNVYIGGGAKILGPIHIGDDVIIGVNSIVLENIKSNTIHVADTARFLKNIESIKEFI